MVDIHEVAVIKNEDVLQYFWGERFINKIYTTNFEFLLERCFGGSAAKTVTDKNIKQLRQKLNKIKTKEEIKKIINEV